MKLIPQSKLMNGSVRDAVTFFVWNLVHLVVKEEHAIPVMKWLNTMASRMFSAPSLVSLSSNKDSRFLGWAPNLPRNFSKS